MNTKTAALAAAALLTPLSHAQVNLAGCLEDCRDTYPVGSAEYDVCVTGCQFAFIDALQNTFAQFNPPLPWPFPADAAFRVEFDDLSSDPPPTPLIVIDPRDPVFGLGAMPFFDLRALTPDVLFGDAAQGLITQIPATQLNWTAISVELLDPNGNSFTADALAEPTGTGRYFHVDLQDTFDGLPEDVRYTALVRVESPDFQDIGGVIEVATVLYPTRRAFADLAAPAGVLDLSDIDGFVAGFLNQSNAADLAQPFGVLDLNDTDTFIDAFLGN